MMPRQFQHQLAQAVHGVSLTKKSVRWFGDKVADIARLPHATSRHDEERSPLEQLVASILYSFFYTLGRPILKGEYEALNSETPDVSIASQLAAANPGTGEPRRVGSVLKWQWQTTCLLCKKMD